MNARRPIIALAAALLLMGAGCDLSRRIEWRLPFSLEKALPAADPAAATAALALESGLSFTVRPSRLGMSGAIDEAFGLDARALQVRVRDIGEGGKIVLEWTTASATGSLALGGRGEAQAMLLPSFWPEGDASAAANGGLWLSERAYEDLTAGSGRTEWRLGLAENALAALSKAFTAFNDISSRLYGTATSSAPASPFIIEKTAVVEAYPMTVDGRIVLVRAVKASGWFGEFLVLENKENPLILKATVNPLAEPALRALESAEVRWQELGYEITSLRRP